MLTVADELFISGLPDDTRAIVERYIASKTTRYYDAPDPAALRGAYERGYAAGAADARRGMAMEAQPDLPLDSKEAA